MRPGVSSAPDRATLLAFAGTVLIGGANFISVKFSNQELDPLYGAAVRFFIGSLILFAVMAVRRIAMPTNREISGAVVFGVLNFGLTYALLYFALTGIGAGTSSVILAMVPLMTLVLAVLHRQESFTLRGVSGGLLAVAGIAVISYRSVDDEIGLIYLLAALAGGLAGAEASVLVKSFPRPHPVTTNAFGMMAGAAALGIGSMLFQEDWVVPQQTRTWLALAWLILAGSVVMFGLFLFVIKRWTASASVYSLTLMPVVAVTLGALLANEPITAGLLVGGVLVLSGVYVGALSGTKAKTTEDACSAAAPTLAAVEES